MKSFADSIDKLRNCFWKVTVRNWYEQNLDPVKDIEPVTML